MKDKSIPNNGSESVLTRRDFFRDSVVASGVLGLSMLAEQAAHSFGRAEVVINAHPTSLAFYLANGYREGPWRDKGPVPATLIRVGKQLR